VTCSGVQKDGSLRIVRNGIGINEQVHCIIAYINLYTLCTECILVTDGASLQAQTASTDVATRVVVILSSSCTHTVWPMSRLPCITAVLYCAMVYRHLLSCKELKACGHCVQAQMLSLTST
jgi:hypothetical protein